MLDKNLNERVTLDGDDIKTVDRFSHLGDVLYLEEGIQEAVTSTIKSGLKKFKDVSCIMYKKGMSPRIKKILYKCFVQSTLSYDAQCRAMRER